MRRLADLAYLLAGLLYLPLVLYQAVVVGKNRRGWRERFGAVPRFDPSRKRIWIHAVSLGEINATPRLVKGLGERLPGTDIVFSTTTDTGYARAVQLYGAARVFRFPLDFSFVVTRVLERVNPSLIVLVELEVWYNLARMATRHGTPVVVVNGRLTAHSARRFQRTGRFARAMFADLAWVGAQDEAIAERFIDLGVPRDRIEVTSSLKWDTASVVDRVDGDDSLARAVGIDGARPLWVCGSTGPGEEALILDAYRELLRGRRDLTPAGRDRTGASTEHENHADPQLVIVPRKPERFDEVARFIHSAGFTCLRRSEHDDEHPVEATSESAVILGDTMGELRKFYALATVVFVGRSLVPMGGSDPMEVAALGKPVVVGPHMENFELANRALGDADALRVVGTVDALVSTIRELLQDDELAKGMGTRARAVVLRNQGATQRTVERVAGLFEDSEAARAGTHGSGRSARGSVRSSTGGLPA